MDPASVVQNLEKLLSQGKDSALLRFSLGAEYLKLKQTWVAVYQLRRALEMDPNYSAAWKLLGKALTDAGVLRDALDAYRRGVAIAEQRGDKQAAKEMAVVAQRLEKQLQS
jgi:Tfp pilus assembly protein PilF